MDAEPTLILDNINVFITLAAKAKVEDLEEDMERVREALKGLCGPLVEMVVGWDVCIHHGIPVSVVSISNRLLREYVRERGIQNPSEYDINYIGGYILGHDITFVLADGDELILSIYYLRETPFIRLNLGEVTIRLRDDFPVERLRNKELRCHLNAVVHRLGVVAVTCWVEVPIQLTVKETNRLIDTLTEGQADTVVHALMKEQVMEMLRETGTLTLRQYLQGLVEILLITLIQVLRGEGPSLERMRGEDIRRYVVKYIEGISIINEVLHIGGVSKINKDGSTAPITSAEDLVTCCPRQVAALVTGRVNWRSYTRDNAVKECEKARVAIYPDELVTADMRGVVISLREPDEPDFLRNVNSVLRDPSHERHHHSVLQSFTPNVLRIYQLVGIIEIALKAYNSKIRGYPLEEARLSEIERLRDLVKRGLEEISIYFPVRVEPIRTILRMALEARGVLSLREVVERRLDYMHRVLVERTSRRTNQLLLVLTFYLAVLGVYSIVQTLPAQTGMGFWLALLIVAFFITITAITALISVDLLVDLILSAALRLRRVFRSLARL